MAGEILKYGRCGKCIFWVCSQEGIGICVRYPPKRNGDVVKVSSGSMCGEFARVNEYEGVIDDVFQREGDK